MIADILRAHSHRRPGSVNRHKRKETLESSLPLFSYMYSTLQTISKVIVHFQNFTGRLVGLATPEKNMVVADILRADSLDLDRTGGPDQPPKHRNFSCYT